MNGAPWLSAGRVSVLGTGHALPGAAVSSDALVALMADRFGFARERQALAIAKRLMIGHRHLCRPFAARSEAAAAGQSNPEIAARAARQAIDQAGLAVGDIGYLIGHSATPLQPLPPNVALVADYLGYSGPHLEIRQACTGFANALVVAFGLLARTDAPPVLIVGSETGSLFFDPARADTDAGQLVNMMQMGDGAGAIVLGPPRTDAAQLTAAWYGAIGLNRSPGIQMRSGAREFDHDFAEIATSGRALFEAGAVAAARHGVAVDESDIVIPHQVSGRIGMQVADHMGIPPSRLFVNADRTGNTGSAAIWIALAMLRAEGLIPGTRVVALGAEASKYMYGGFAYQHR
jgi:3-oxoacyl-[acyl-carrier-protein] synthase-3